MFISMFKFTLFYERPQGTAGLKSQDGEQSAAAAAVAELAGCWQQRIAAPPDKKINKTKQNKHGNM